MAIKKNEFIELEFSARIKGGEIFDSTRREDAKILELKEESIKPLIFVVGHNMVVSGLDKDIIGKELAKEYRVEIAAKEAFGKREGSLIQMVPLKNFIEQKITPQKGMQFSFDGKLAKILSVSGGRVLVDFNHVLAGKDVVYDYKILKKIEDKKEQFEALEDFFFRKRFDSEITDKEIKVRMSREFSPMFELMKKKFEEILERNITIEIIPKKEEDKIE